MSGTILVLTKLYLPFQEQGVFVYLSQCWSPCSLGTLWRGLWSGAFFELGDPVPPCLWQLQEIGLYSSRGPAGVL